MSKEYKSAVLQLQTALDFHNSNSLGEYNVNWKSVELILEYIKNLQKKAEHQKQMIKSQYGTIKSINKTSQNRKEAIKSLLVQNEKLKKKAELGEHYKHLYSEVKKQKDDAIKLIHKELDRFDCEGSMSISMRISYFEDDVIEYIKNNNLIYNHDCGEIFRNLLRMLGEIDVED